MYKYSYNTNVVTPFGCLVLCCVCYCIVSVLFSIYFAFGLVFNVCAVVPD